ncbi:inactive tyrosine-protein kinase transmembrane receptor ROR1-like [Asterias rubens]|uniref:inactive tyrosine-protein kinase transmembrane receptor ROR1-like n=1 Tax=Asterias rubens TaxID=7604 RepID=UPI0014553F93|nr:inactive tyrosine-protein kinase transmembrane receptor ROR1-like [Asterias rubens]
MLMRTAPADGIPEIKIDEPMNNETVSVGDKVTLLCRIRGFPQPEYWWYHKDAYMKDDVGRVTIRKYPWGSKLMIKNVDTLDAGFYKCIAQNDAGSKTTTGLITILPGPFSEGSDSDYSPNVDNARCEPYRGAVCRRHISSSSVYMRADTTQEEIEQEVQAALTRLASIVSLSEPCSMFITPSICLTAFPLCRESPDLSIHQLCRDECQLLETDVCASLYDHVDSQVELDLVGVLPVCSDLPRLGSQASEMCFRLGMSNSGDATVSPWQRPTGDYISLERPMNNETKLVTGDRAILRCRITGNPEPRYTWFKNDVQISERGNRRITIRTYDWGSKLSIRNVDTTDTGYYLCEADNKAGIRSTTGILLAKLDTAPPSPPQPGESMPTKGYCQPYRGMTCANFIGNNSIYVTDYQAQGEVEEKLTSAFLVIMHDLSDQCQEFAIPSLCYFAFPFCDSDAADPLGRELCRDECEILELDMCQQEYAIAKEYPGVTLPDCQRLPQIGTKESENCIRIGIPSVKAVTDVKCYNGTGIHYRGKVNHTKSGYECQPWDSQQPHGHYLMPATYPELAGGHNYCRNPDNALDKPWCFTMNPNIRAEKCDISKCDDPFAEPANKLEVLYIVVPAIAVLLVIAVIMGCVCMCWRQQRAQRFESHKGLNNRPAEMVALQQKPQVRDFPLAAIKFQEVLGEGTFGKVYKGELMGLEHQYSVNQVTIKTLKENSATKMEQDFNREAEVMASLRHPNIISLLGVCTKEQPMCMLFEFMPHGDLHEFLVRHSPNSDVGFGSGDDETQSSLDQSDFLSIAIQIASGMEYLSSRLFVHRDLAARNCMVGDNLQIKIADFGLSRDIYSADYYHMQAQVLLPIRWMAPEAVMFGRFSVESDIWSYGVVVWEIYSYGLQPFYGYNNQEVIDMIRTRHILPCPSGCPPHMYVLMTECWNEAPNLRPHFKAINARLRSWEALPATNHQNGNLYTNPTVNFSPMYGPTSPTQTHSSSGVKSQLSSHHSRSTHSNSKGSHGDRIVGGSSDKAMSESSATTGGTQSTKSKKDRVEQTAV